MWAELFLTGLGADFGIELSGKNKRLFEHMPEVHLDFHIKRVGLHFDKAAFHI